MGNEDNQNKRQEQDWEFKISVNDDKKSIAPDESSLMLSSKKNKKKIISKTNELTLEENERPKSKTRTHLSRELDNADEIKYRDYYQYADTSKRAMAMIVDFSVLVIFYKILKILKPLALNSFHNYFADIIIERFFLGGGFFLVLFFFLVLPLAFYNTSLGKKIVGLRVRGVENYTLSFFQAFMREILLKPLSLLLIFGLITPFFTKKHQSIHDILSNTFVIED